MGYDDAWAREVTAWCDPVMEAADVGFVRQVMHDEPGVVTAILWEADPARFAAAYPDSGIVESYGTDQWAGVHCIDYWLYVDPRPRLSVEGWNLPDLYVDLTGYGGLDGSAVACVLARVLGVPAPTG